MLDGPGRSAADTPVLARLLRAFGNSACDAVIVCVALARELVALLRFVGRGVCARAVLAAWLLGARCQVLAVWPAKPGFARASVVSLGDGDVLVRLTAGDGVLACAGVPPVMTMEGKRCSLQTHVAHSYVMFFDTKKQSYRNTNIRSQCEQSSHTCTRQL